MLTNQHAHPYSVGNMGEGRAVYGVHFVNRRRGHSGYYTGDFFNGIRKTDEKTDMCAF